MKQEFYPTNKDTVSGEDVFPEKETHSPDDFKELKEATGIEKKALEKIGASPRLRKLFLAALISAGIFVGAETHAQTTDSSGTKANIEQLEKRSEADSALIHLIEVVQKKKLFEDFDYYYHAQIGKYTIEYQGKDEDPEAYYDKKRADVSFKDEEGTDVVIGHNFGVFQAIGVNDHDIDPTFKKMTIHEFKKTFGVILRGPDEDIVYAKKYDTQEAASMLHTIIREIEEIKK